LAESGLTTVGLVRLWSTSQTDETEITSLEGTSDTTRFRSTVWFLLTRAKLLALSPQHKHFIAGMHFAAEQHSLIADAGMQAVASDGVDTQNMASMHKNVSKCRSRFISMTILPPE
jgi:hypothetical protein